MTEEASFLEAPGELVAPEHLRAKKARTLYQTLETEHQEFCTLRECRQVELSKENEVLADVVVFDVDVEVGQRPVHGIRKLERIAALFRHDDRAVPEAFALRADFPLVPHINALSSLRAELPRSLCLYDEPFHEVRLTWTPAAFLRRVCDWLARTARGELHAEDQPLEPLLIGSPWSIVLPNDLFEYEEEERTLRLAVQGQVEDSLGSRLLLTKWLSETQLKEEGLPCAVVTLEGSPQEHGIIRHTPFNLEELRKFLEDAQLNLYAELREQLLFWREHHELDKLKDHPIIIVVALPKLRTAGRSVETSDIWGFEVDETLDELGQRFDLWETRGDLGARGHILEAPSDGGATPAIDGSEVQLLPLNVNFEFSREMAAVQAAGASPDDRKIVAIGAGALGSQVFINAVRQGWGEWTLIDHDRLMPHNLARHALPSLYIGHSKTNGLAHLANETVSGKQIASSIVADVLAPRDREEEVNEALDQADIVLDTSASVAVERYLARDTGSTARKLSLFFNPSGTDGVMLCEDEERDCPLDWLEMRYYRELITSPKLKEHLKQAAAGRVRYARTCGDVSAVLAQDRVALHAAIGARACRSVLEGESSSILIWRTSEADLGVEHIEVEATPSLEQQVCDWTIVTDQWLMDKVARKRSDNLPNETGGVLVGAHDMQRKIVYVVDSLPSPPDSTEWPAVYIRGRHGLRSRVEEIRQITNSHLDYIGEWHSHPRDHSPSPSSDDRRAFEWLSDMLAPESMPATMLIVGEGESAWHVGEMP